MYDANTLCRQNRLKARTRVTVKARRIGLSWMSLKLLNIAAYAYQDVHVWCTL